MKFVFSDDWLDPRYLERAIPVMESNPEVALLTTAGYVVDEQGRTFGLSTAEFGEGPVVPAREALRAQADHLNLIGMPTNVVIRRAAAERVGGFDPRFAPASDVHLWLRLLSEHDLGWVPEPLCFLRIHAAKGHDFGADPSESTFLSWEDVARQPRSPIDGELLAAALYAEAERSLLYVAAHLAFGRVRRAWRIVRFTGQHVRWRRVVPRFLRRVPRLAGGQLARIRALRSGRMVIYGRRTRIGPRLDARP